jgi:hypothetical protein
MWLIWRMQCFPKWTDIDILKIFPGEATVTATNMLQQWNMVF